MRLSLCIVRRPFLHRSLTDLRMLARDLELHSGIPRCRRTLLSTKHRDVAT